jgi:hypothetical protein
MEPEITTAEGPTGDDRQWALAEPRGESPQGET